MCVVLFTGGEGGLYDVTSSLAALSNVSSGGGGLCPEGSLSREVSLQGGRYLGVLSRVSVWGYLSVQGSLGVSVRETSVWRIAGGK